MAGGLAGIGQGDHDVLTCRLSRIATCDIAHAVTVFPPLAELREDDRAMST